MLRGLHHRRVAVSASLGSSNRDSVARFRCGEGEIEIRRIGTNGDLGDLKTLLGELDGKVDAIGIGGANLGLEVGKHVFPLPEIRKAVERVRKTPVVDGTRLKQALESGVARELLSRPECEQVPRRALFVSGVDRWHLSMGFVEAGLDYAYGDLMFGLGIPIAIRKVSTFNRLVPLLLPLISKIPFRLLYPTGADQEHSRPRFTRWYEWAGFLCGDCHYIKKHASDSLDGKVVVTNTTTREDVDFFRLRGVRFLVTSTPVLQGRSFGTNLMEAALIAASGQGRHLSCSELRQYARELGWEPTLRRL